MCDPVPEIIMQHCASIILSIDIMYVNGITFLVTTSRTIRFGTIESIPNRQIPTVVKALGRVLALYHRRQLRISTVYADPEFRPLQDEMTSVPFDFLAQGQHVPDVERYICTVKDCT